MDEAQIEEAFAHLSDDEFVELVVGFTEDGVPLVEDSLAFKRLWNI